MILTALDDGGSGFEYESPTSVVVERFGLGIQLARDTTRTKREILVRRWKSLYTDDTTIVIYIILHYTPRSGYKSRSE